MAFPVEQIAARWGRWFGKLNRIGPHIPGHHLEELGLSGTAGADHQPALARVHMPTDVVQDGPAAAGQIQPFQPDLELG
jgi:hypothetical protein